MLKSTSAIILIDDDRDDIELLKQIIEEVNPDVPLKTFSDCDEAFEYISRKDVVPFMILSDINMPRLTGFQLRDKIQEDDELRRKCIPYIFMTTSTGGNHVMEAYSKNAQGFFIKPNVFEEWKTLITHIFDYWKHSKKPQ